ncbi:SdiA-regulated protein [Tenacibaculum lutimaris]|uniref:SdiA-regulated protein n=1 Tax=Tenacibaculum lutimaris TaxID=285258 RepID=A0A420E2J2_9FLAO|nr:SdiA-regulated domain-containing protein [Tenacibaculum lutimaris]RKF04269.1 SdiA-regulated protein [Tenacibaculum lutimaris]
MKKLSIFFFLFILLGCQNYGQLSVVTNLPKLLDEVSGIQKEPNSDKIWMVNDSGNKPELYRVTSEGEIEKTISINAKNYDWEDIASDDNGNIYIADFGNNNNKRKNLVILKIKEEDLLNGDDVEVEKIKFSYPNQTKFPPKKKDRFFDAESLIYKDGALYIFTKSRVKNKHGKTMLYKVPATKGEYTAQYISEYANCNDVHCAITAAAISPDKQKVVLLTHQSVLVFTNFNGDDFFSGDVKEYTFNHISQKEGVTFKDERTLYITDEADKIGSSKLYEFVLKD